MFNIGDKVKTIYTGYGYTTFSRWAERNNLVNWKYGAYVPRNVEAKVVAVDTHSENGTGDVLVGIEYYGQTYIIGAKGVELVRKALPDVFKFKCASGIYKMVRASDGKFKCLYVHEDNAANKVAYWSDEDILRHINSRAWTIVEDATVAAPAANGVDAEGKPLNFTKDMLKPFMRVVTKNGNSYIVTPDAYNTDELVLVRPEGWTDFKQLEDACGDYIFESFSAAKVYAQPEVYTSLLNPTEYGELIWEHKSEVDRQAEEALKVRKAYLQKQIDEVNENLESLRKAMAELEGN